MQFAQATVVKILGIPPLSQFLGLPVEGKMAGSNFADEQIPESVHALTNTLSTNCLPDTCSTEVSRVNTDPAPMGFFFKIMHFFTDLKHLPGRCVLELHCQALKIPVHWKQNVLIQLKFTSFSIECGVHGKITRYNKEQAFCTAMTCNLMRASSLLVGSEPGMLPFLLSLHMSPFLPSEPYRYPYVLQSAKRARCTVLLGRAFIQCSLEKVSEKDEVIWLPSSVPF
ncbi:hypothetical protein STEG23_015738 [Scotinomys teguina]